MRVLVRPSPWCPGFCPCFHMQCLVRTCLARCLAPAQQVLLSIDGDTKPSSVTVLHRGFEPLYVSTNHTVLCSQVHSVANLPRTGTNSTRVTWNPSCGFDECVFGELSHRAPEQYVSDARRHHVLHFQQKSSPRFDQRTGGGLGPSCLEAYFLLEDSITWTRHNW